MAVGGVVPFSRTSGSGYDLSIDGVHTYLVGPTGVLVHNCDPRFGISNYKNGGYMDSLDHILREHSHGADDTKSQFLAETSREGIARMVKLAADKGRVVNKSGDRVEKVYDFGIPTGTGVHGEETTGIRVFVHLDGTILTGFPDHP